MQVDNMQMCFPNPGWRLRLDRYFAELGQGVNAAALIRARMAEILGLEALSDAELRARGLCRQAIPAAVFSDLFSAPHPG